MEYTRILDIFRPHFWLPLRLRIVRKVWNISALWFLEGFDVFDHNIPSLEYELLFPHNTEIEVYGIQEIEVLCKEPSGAIASRLYLAKIISEPF